MKKMFGSAILASVLTVTVLVAEPGHANSVGFSANVKTTVVYDSGDVLLQVTDNPNYKPGGRCSTDYVKIRANVPAYQTWIGIVLASQMAGKPVGIYFDSEPCASAPAGYVPLVNRIDGYSN